ncbi:myb-like protein X [Pelobates fuscus]|uniref:myb-like protein X n=1 Tax=Pelobates fuscus TaxID=191477 RepID=UPI002FE4849F
MSAEEINTLNQHLEDTNSTCHKELGRPISAPVKIIRNNCFGDDAVSSTKTKESHRKRWLNGDHREMSKRSKEEKPFQNDLHNENSYKVESSVASSENLLQGHLASSPKVTTPWLDENSNVVTPSCTNNNEEGSKELNCNYEIEKAKVTGEISNRNSESSSGDSMKVSSNCKDPSQNNKEPVVQVYSEEHIDDQNTVDYPKSKECLVIEENQQEVAGSSKKKEFKPVQKLYKIEESEKSERKRLKEHAEESKRKEGSDRGEKEKNKVSESTGCKRNDKTDRENRENVRKDKKTTIKKEISNSQSSSNKITEKESSGVSMEGPKQNKIDLDKVVTNKTTQSSEKTPTTIEKKKKQHSDKSKDKNKTREELVHLKTEREKGN